MKKTIISFAILLSTSSAFADEIFKCNAGTQPTITITISKDGQLASIQDGRKNSKGIERVVAKLPLIVKTVNGTRLFEGDDGSGDPVESSEGLYPTGEAAPYTLVITSLPSVAKLISYNEAWSCSSER